MSDQEDAERRYPEALARAVAGELRLPAARSGPFEGNAVLQRLIDEGCGDMTMGELYRAWREARLADLQRELAADPAAWRREREGTWTPEEGPGE